MDLSLNPGTISGRNISDGERIRTEKASAATLSHFFSFDANECIDTVTRCCCLTRLSSPQSPDSQGFCLTKKDAEQQILKKKKRGMVPQQK